MNNRLVSVKILLGTLSFLLAVVQVVLLNYYSTSGEKLLSFQEQTKELEVENNRLRQKIASASSITTIIVKAKDFGLNESQKLVSLTSPQPLAFFQKSSL